MPEKYNFSKIEDQKKFEELPEKEREDNEKEVIVEIGPGGMPIYELSDDVLEKIKKGASYVAIDADISAAEDILFRDNKEISNKPKSILGELSELPIKNESVNNIWLLNVFGSMTKIILRPEKNADGTYSSNEITKYFNELSRIIKLKGEIVICEFYPPVSGDLRWLRNINYNNFGLEASIYNGEKIEEFLKIHRFKEEVLDVINMMKINAHITEKPFFIILKKKIQKLSF